ncbi:protein LATERAL ROOT PRIMORDIUM 1-like [Impatiens glandulifera]|uniref:protein LATERAL ROOT PRIMORDIUM 1-like n=1 Tax=Impatiens glandulifera TaxID=253017 RepID=UPI001FB0D267|nr:protein LATERAL ROOT PRIMORDIUM 1-like [Impatiens glandulifera]
MGHFRDVFVGPNNINLLAAGQINLLSAEPNNSNNNNIDTGIQLWQNQPVNLFHGGSSVTAAGTLSCQDCGNQAKKDCTHRRCRTCCKSRGFDCSTHLKSTWVPAARRRERQLMTTANIATAGSSGSTSGTKKPRLNITSQTTTTSHTSTSNTTPRSFETTSSHQEGNFKETMPGQVRASAVFKCVRVTAVDDGDDEYAYQAVVKIGGHIFKGFLYDQGPEVVVAASRDGFPNMSDLHLGPVIDPPSSDQVYQTAGGGLLGGLGSAYGNQIN